MVKVLQSMDLFLVKVLHFEWGDYLIVVQVYHFEPVLQGSQGGLVLFAQHEPHEVLVPHLVLGVALELARNLLEDPVHCFS